MSQSVRDLSCSRPCRRTALSIPEWAQVLFVAGVILAGLIVLMALHQPAWAQEADEPAEQISVSYFPADLSDPVRARHLLVRIDRAALKACGKIDGLSIPMQEVIERSDCHHETFTRTVAAIHNPWLTQMADALDPWVGPTLQNP